MTPDEALDEITQISQELGLYKMTEPTRKEEFIKDLEHIQSLFNDACQENGDDNPVCKMWIKKFNEFIEKWGPKDEPMQTI